MAMFNVFFRSKRVLKPKVFSKYGLDLTKYADFLVYVRVFKYSNCIQLYI